MQVPPKAPQMRPGKKCSLTSYKSRGKLRTTKYLPGEAGYRQNCFRSAKSVWIHFLICACCTSTASLLHDCKHTLFELEYRRSKYVSPRLGMVLWTNATTLEKNFKGCQMAVVAWGRHCVATTYRCLLETCHADSSKKHSNFLKVKVFGLPKIRVILKPALLLKRIFQTQCQQSFLAEIAQIHLAGFTSAFKFPPHQWTHHSGELPIDLDPTPDLVCFRSSAFWFLRLSPYVRRNPVLLHSLLHEICGPSAASCLYALFRSKERPLTVFPLDASTTFKSKAAMKSIEWGFGDSAHCTVLFTSLADRSSINLIFPGCFKPNLLLTTDDSGNWCIGMGPMAPPKSTSSKVLLYTFSSTSGSPEEVHL